MDRLILKLFEEEADLPIYLFVDASRSMDFGTPSKLDYARQLAAALAYVALLNHDRVNLVAFADGAACRRCPRGAARTRRRRRSAFSRASRRADRPACRRRCAASSASPRTRGLVVVISDFLDPRRHRAGVRGAAPLPPRGGRGPHVISPKSASRSCPKRWCWSMRRTAPPASSRSRRACSRPTARRFQRHVARDRGLLPQVRLGLRAGARPPSPFEDLMLKMLRERAGCDELV